ncbi:MAG: chemotaxis protein CheB [Bdellovibrionaceae bacterium]|nr:chemotaxis protein CheB [Pseudobdellovibrionaceae bacterium]
MSQKIKYIFIGASAGGIATIQKLFSQSSGKHQVPIVVVQHLPANSNLNLPLVFGAATENMNLVEVIDKTKIQKGHVYFAPPGYHLLIEKDDSFSLSQDDPVHFARPSIDVLFESAAHAYGPSVCGILLTGANADGALGLKEIHDCGGYTMIQHPDDAEFSFMPQSALDLFQPDFVGSISDLSRKISELARGNAQ